MAPKSLAEEAQRWFRKNEKKPMKIQNKTKNNKTMNTFEELAQQRIPKRTTTKTDDSSHGAPFRGRVREGGTANLTQQ